MTIKILFHYYTILYHIVYTICRKHWSVIESLFTYIFPVHKRMKIWGETLLGRFSSYNIGPNSIDVKKVWRNRKTCWFFLPSNKTRIASSLTVQNTWVMKLKADHFSCLIIKLHNWWGWWQEKVRQKFDFKSGIIRINGETELIPLFVTYYSRTTI